MGTTFRRCCHPALSLPSHWPELSHVTMLSCKGGWEYSLFGTPMCLPRKKLGIPSVDGKGRMDMITVSTMIITVYVVSTYCV